MARAIRSLFVRVGRWMNHPTPRKVVLVPYILIGTLWYLNGVSDDQARARDVKTAEILAAEVLYRTNVDNYQTKQSLRKDCVDDVNARNNTRENWHKLYDFIGSLSERG